MINHQNNTAKISGREAEQELMQNLNNLVEICRRSNKLALAVTSLIQFSLDYKNIIQLTVAPSRSPKSPALRSSDRACARSAYEWYKRKYQLARS